MDLRTELIEFLDSIREYVKESGTNIAHDERDSSEFVDIHLQSKLKQPTVVSAVCTCEVNKRKHFETILNQCRFCEKPLIQTDL